MNWLKESKFYSTKFVCKDNGLSSVYSGFDTDPKKFLVDRSNQYLEILDEFRGNTHHLSNI